MFTCFVTCQWTVSVVPGLTLILWDVIHYAMDDTGQMSSCDQEYLDDMAKRYSVIIVTVCLAVGMFL